MRSLLLCFWQTASLGSAESKDFSSQGKNAFNKGHSFGSSQLEFKIAMWSLGRFVPVNLQAKEGVTLLGDAVNSVKEKFAITQCQQRGYLEHRRSWWCLFEFSYPVMKNDNNLT